MQNIKKYNIIAILTISVVAGIFNNIPLSYAQDNSTMTNTPMTNLTQTEEEEEEYTTTEAGHSAEEEEKEHNETSTVRDSVTELLDSQIIPGGDFIHLYDTTPYHILNGHVALKAPCEDDSITPIQILIGSAPNMTAAKLLTVDKFIEVGEIGSDHWANRAYNSKQGNNIVLDRNELKEFVTITDASFGLIEFKIDHVSKYMFSWIPLAKNHKF